MSYIQNHFKAVLFVFLVIIIFMPQKQATPANLATIKLNGELFKIDDILEKIDTAYSDQNIKGVLLDVNSPGGALAPSIELSMAIKRLKEAKPVVAYASGTMASGSYYASIHANRIIANPGAFIGSIGVIMLSPNFEQLIDKTHVKMRTIKAGKYKEMGTIARAWSEDETKALEKLVNDSYELFTTDVAKARGLNKNKLESFADAKVFLAKDAKDVGLIDEVGSIWIAKEQLIKLSGVKEATWQKPDKIDVLLEKIANKASLPMMLNWSNFLR